MQEVRDSEGRPFATWVTGSPLAAADWPGDVLWPAGRVAAWSGTLGDGPFAADIRTWGPRGWGMLDAACERLAVAGRAVCFRSHAAHVLSDVPSCARFLKQWGERGFEVAPDPVMMLTEEMAAGRHAEDFVRRVLEWVAAHVEDGGKGIAGVFVTEAGRAGVAAEMVGRLVDEILPSELKRVCA